MENDYSIRAVERTLNILHCYNSERKAISMMEFAQLLSLNKSTVFRFLANLRAHGFLDIDADNKYILGSEVARLGQLAEPTEILKNKSKNTLRRIADLSGETVVLAKYENEKLTCIDKIESDKALKITSVIGENIPLLLGATGKSVAAFLPDDELERCVAIHQTPDGKSCDRERLRQDLLAIRQKGYSVTSNELDQGVTAFAVPVMGRDDRVVGSISIAGPGLRFDTHMIDEIKEQAIQQVAEISQKLGYSKEGKS